MCGLSVLLLVHISICVMVRGRKLGRSKITGVLRLWLWSTSKGKSAFAVYIVHF